MTVTHRKRTQVPDEIQAVNEPGLQIQCDNCLCDLTHSIRIKCADPACETGDGIDICPACFCAGKEFKTHKRTHPYRVVELHSYPIFTEDWGADEELLLLEGIALQGLGNWQAVSEHVGTRTKEEVEQHYNSVYINSPDWPLPRMNLEFDIDPSLFQERKRRRISTMAAVSSGPKPAPTSAPGVHEIATFLPGRLEFEHELDNEAEDLVKDLEFGICLEYGGNQISKDENDNDMVARVKLEEEKRLGHEKYPSPNGVDLPSVFSNSHQHINGKADVRREVQVRSDTQEGSTDGDANVEEPIMPPPIETAESVNFKLTLLEMYGQRVDKRIENKAIMFDRCLLEYKKMQAQEKKRPKEDKDIAHRLRPFAKLQTAEDYEAFVDDESTLRKRIQELQHYRRMGLTTAVDIEKFENDVAKRTSVKASIAQNHSSERPLFRNRGSTGPDARRASVGSFAESELGKDRDNTPRPKLPGSNPAPLFRKQPAPLNLAQSASLHLLTPAEQTLCSTLRILPKPYLVMKETLVREYSRKGGKLRRREARDLIKIDVNKTSKVWDFLVQAGFLRVPPAERESGPGGAGNLSQAYGASPTKDYSTPRPTLPTASPSISPPSKNAAVLPQPFATE